MQCFFLHGEILHSAFCILHFSPPSFAGILFHNQCSLSNKNVPVLPKRRTGTEKTFLRYHPDCRKIRPLSPVPTHRLPVNAGNASEDTRVSPFPLPSAAHLPDRFSLRSQLCGTLCGCASGFTPASVVSKYVMPIKHEMCAFVKNFFTPCADDSQYSRTTALTMPIISA